MSTRPDAGPNAMDAIDTPPELDRRAAEAPHWRPFLFAFGPHFTRKAKCRHGHAIGGDASWCVGLGDVHRCSVVFHDHPCNEWSWIYTFSSTGALIVPIRSSEIAPLRELTRDAAAAIDFLGFLTQAEAALLWMHASR